MNQHEWEKSLGRTIAISDIKYAPDDSLAVVSVTNEDGNSCNAHVLSLQNHHFSRREVWDPEFVTNVNAADMTKFK